MNRRRYLFAMWEGGGTLPPELGICRRLIARGHHVRVIADATVEEAARRAGCAFTSWTRAPNRTSLDPDHDPMKDWEVGNPLTMIRRARDAMIAGPAADYAADVREAIRTHGIDALLADHLLAGAMLGGQAEGIPVISVVPNIWMLPTAGAVPPGPGFGPPSGPLVRWRNRLVAGLVNRVFDAALPTLNAAREANGLPPLAHFYDQMTDVDRVLVLTSPSFDFSSPFVPSNVRYVGPVLDDPSWANGPAPARPTPAPPPGPAASPASGAADASAPPTPPTLEPAAAAAPTGAAADPRPLVLVALSSTFQDQVDALRRIVAALATLPVRAVVTLGRNVHPDEVPGAENVEVVASAPHGPILERAALAITHCGHGTTLKALAAGVPLVCMPMGRDQNDNAARVEHLGAGVKVAPSASSATIARAARRVLDEARYRTAATRFAATLATEARATDVVAEIEAVSDPMPVMA